MRSLQFIRHSLFVAALAATIASGGCAGAEASSPLTNAHSSREALLDAVMAALRADSREALESLIVTSEERETYLWPLMPDSEHMPFAFAEDVRRINNREGVGNALSRYGGGAYEVVEITFSKPAEVYEGFTLYRGAELKVRRLSDGVVGMMPILDVILEMGGMWKLIDVEE